MSRFAVVLSGFLALANAARLAAQPITAPTINAVVSAADNTSGVDIGIPRGSLITIYGLNLARSPARAHAFPLSTILNGVRVHVDGFDALPLFVSEDQLSALMPSAVPEGSHSVTVEPDGVVSAPYGIQVITARFAAFTASWLGFGPAVLQQYDGPGQLSRNRFLGPAHPGQAVVLWGTGLGPLPAGASDANPPAAGSIRDDVMVYVAGIPVKPFYAGRSPSLAGVDQINFFLPSGMPNRCMVPFAVSAAGSNSGVMTLAVSPGGSACTSEFGLSNAALGNLDQGGSVRMAVLSLVTNSTPNLPQTPKQTAEAWIGYYDAAHLALLATTDFLPDAFSPGSCSYQSTTQSFGHPPPPNLMDVHGQTEIPGLTEAIQITGSSGCSWTINGFNEFPWVYTGSSDSCAATAFSFSAQNTGQPILSASGALPAPPPANTIANLQVTQSSGNWRASWQIDGPTSGDRLALTAGSSFTLDGALFWGQSQQNTLTCNVSPAQGAFTFPQPDASNAFSLRDNHTVSMSLTSVADHIVSTGLPAGAPNGVDLLLIRTGNAAAASVPVGY